MEQITADNNPIDSLTRQVEEFRIIAQLESINKLNAEKCKRCQGDAAVSRGSQRALYMEEEIAGLSLDVAISV